MGSAVAPTVLSVITDFCVPMLDGVAVITTLRLRAARKENDANRSSSASVSRRLNVKNTVLTGERYLTITRGGR